VPDDRERLRFFARIARIPPELPLAHIFGAVVGDKVQGEAHLDTEAFPVTWDPRRRKGFSLQRYHGWRVEFVGTPDLWTPPGELPTGCTVLAGHAIVRNWVQRAWRHGSPAAAEIFWHPEDGQTWSVRSYGHAGAHDEYSAAQRGLDLLRVIENRDSGSMGRDRNEDLRLAVDVAHQLIKGGVNKPAALAIYDELVKDEPSLTSGALAQRWQRHKPAIRMGEILRLARQPRICI